MGILSQVKFLAWLSATLYLFSIICNQLQIMKILKNTYIKENNSLLPSPQHSHSAYTVWKCLGWVMRKVALCNTILFKRVPKQVKGLFLLKKKIIQPLVTRNLHMLPAETLPIHGGLHVPPGSHIVEHDSTHTSTNGQNVTVETHRPDTTTCDSGIHL